MPQISTCRARNIITKALSFPSIKSLYTQAALTPNGFFNLCKAPTCSFVQHPSTGFDAQCSSWDHHIELKSDLSDDQAFTLFVFELTNIINGPKHSNNMINALRGKVSREEFAKTAELIEYEGTLMHHKVIKQALRVLPWWQRIVKCWKWDIYSTNYYINPNIYWAWIKYTSHADYWRKACPTSIPLLGPLIYTTDRIFAGICKYSTTLLSRRYYCMTHKNLCNTKICAASLHN